MPCFDEMVKMKNANIEFVSHQTAVFGSFHNTIPLFAARQLNKEKVNLIKIQCYIQLFLKDFSQAANLGV